MSVRLVAELVGPAGSGKSTALAALRARDPAGVADLYGANSVSGNLAAILFALGFGVRFRLGCRDLIGLLRKCRSVENGIRVLRRLPPRSVLVDEGPVRMMMDTRSRSGRERDAWRSYVHRRLAALDATGPRIEILDLALPPPIRSARLAARRQEAARRESLGAGSAARATKPAMNPLEPLREELIERFRSGCYRQLSYHRLILNGEEGEQEVADSIRAWLSRGREGRRQVQSARRRGSGSC